MRSLKDIKEEHRRINNEIAVLNDGLYVSDIFPIESYQVKIIAKDKRPSFHIVTNDEEYVCSIEDGHIISNTNNQVIEHKVKQWLNEKVEVIENNQKRCMFIWIGLGNHSIEDFSENILKKYGF